MEELTAEGSGVVVGAPLSGEWVALQTPAERVPSHGTDYLGQRYAYDFVRWAPGVNLPYERGLWKHLLAAQPSSAFLCWDQPVFSVFEGIVTETGDGWSDRSSVNLVWALVSSTLFPPQAKEHDLRPLTGNYAIVEGDTAVAFYAHLREGSLTVQRGQQVRSGDVLGRVGNSGNSTMPHLHFQLMDRQDVREARGVLCKFRSFDQLDEQEGWRVVQRGIPEALKRIRWTR